MSTDRTEGYVIRWRNGLNQLIWDYYGDAPRCTQMIRRGPPRLMPPVDRCMNDATYPTAMPIYCWEHAPSKIGAHVKKRELTRLALAKMGTGATLDGRFGNKNRHADR